MCTWTLLKIHDVCGYFALWGLEQVYPAASLLCTGLLLIWISKFRNTMPIHCWRKRLNGRGLLFPLCFTKIYVIRSKILGANIRFYSSIEWEDLQVSPILSLWHSVISQKQNTEVSKALISYTMTSIFSELSPPAGRTALSTSNLSSTHIHIQICTLMVWNFCI